MKYENFAKVGDVIRAYDFQYTRACYLEGRVIEKGMIMHPKEGFPLYDGYTIQVTVDSTGMGRDDDIAYVPFETGVDYDGRIEIVEEVAA